MCQTAIEVWSTADNKPFIGVQCTAKSSLYLDQEPLKGLQQPPLKGWIQKMARKFQINDLIARQSQNPPLEDTNRLKPSKPNRTQISNNFN